MVSKVKFSKSQVGGKITFKTRPGGRKTFLTHRFLFENLIQRGVDRRN